MTDKTPGVPEQLASPNEPAIRPGQADDGAKTIVQSADKAASPSDEGDHAARSSFLWHVHDYLGEYARFADTKAAFSGTISGALLGGLYAANVFKPVVATSVQQWSGTTWTAAAAGLFLSVSITLAMRTIYPRLRSSQRMGFIYWGNIAAFRDVEAFQSSFNWQSADTLNDHLMRQAFDISKHVCIPKYKTVSWCLITLMLGMLLAAGSLLLQERESQLGRGSPASVGIVPATANH